MEQAEIDKLIRQNENLKDDVRRLVSALKEQRASLDSILRWYNKTIDKHIEGGDDGNRT